MNSMIKTLLIASVFVGGSMTASFATPTGGTTLAGGHNGMQAKRGSTMMKHKKMMHRKTMKSGKKM